VFERAFVAQLDGRCIQAEPIYDPSCQERAPRNLEE
jgi:hypothetical protein